MEKTRPILYGVVDYAQIRKKNAWFVDRTAKLRDLEDIAHAALSPLHNGTVPSTGSFSCSTAAIAC